MSEEQFGRLRTIRTLFELGYEALGDPDSRLENVSEWKEPFRKGVIYYYQEEKLRGVVLWNVWSRVKLCVTIWTPATAWPAVFIVKRPRGRVFMRRF